MVEIKVWLLLGAHCASSRLPRAPLSRVGGGLLRRLTDGPVSVRSASQVPFSSANATGEDRHVQAGHVYFVATPIGNLADMSRRAIQVLTEVDMVCAEDTRHTASLLRLLGVPHKKLLSHHEHNLAEAIPQVLQHAKNGLCLAVVSDAGTPGICDPGAQLAAACAKEQIPMHPVPGASALTAALSVCGFPSSSFSFLGFLPFRGADKQTQIERIAASAEVLVFFEAPHRVVDTFAQLVAAGQGDRQCVCAREVTKLYEEFRRGSVSECYAWLCEWSESQARQTSGAVRGEFTIVLGPYAAAEKTVDVEGSLSALRSDGLSRAEAVKLVADMTGEHKAKVYKLALAMEWKSSKEK